MLYTSSFSPINFKLGIFFSLSIFFYTLLSCKRKQAIILSYIFSKIFDSCSATITICSELHFLFLNHEKWVIGDTVEVANENLKKLLKDENIIIDFEKCTNNKKIEDYVLNDRIEGVKKFKVNATPTIIINNKKFDKSLNYKNLKKSIEKLI